MITRLENRKTVSFPARLRQIVQDEIYGLISPFILTDEDLRERTLAKVGARAEFLQDTSFTESEQYKTAKSIVRASFGDDVLNGFYYQKTPREIAKIVREYLMRSSHIDDVYELDEELDRQIVEIMQKFNPNELH
ncbi:MAG: hypothetical protein A3K03_06460 [Bdellovibrionales bacterium RIFOXYD1_FULL_44_7]|nr:MAG: hypothetical protein A3K03_06460 [Bdellovibrionales bacterium RIFOXYD1_FULL_44_7]